MTYLYFLCFVQHKNTYIGCHFIVSIIVGWICSNLHAAGLSGKIINCNLQICKMCAKCANCLGNLGHYLYLGQPTLQKCNENK